MSAVKKMFQHPTTGKRLKRVYVSGFGWYAWNRAYRVYNSVANYSQLQVNEAPLVDYVASSAEEAEKQR